MSRDPEKGSQRQYRTVEAEGAKGRTRLGYVDRQKAQRDKQKDRQMASQVAALTVGAKVS